jgi:hypothetical protein
LGSKLLGLRRRIFQHFDGRFNIHFVFNGINARYKPTQIEIPENLIFESANWSNWERRNCLHGDNLISLRGLMVLSSSGHPSILDYSQLEVRG